MESPEACPVLSFLFRTCQFVARGHRRLAASRVVEPLETPEEVPVANGRGSMLRRLEATALSPSRKASARKTRWTCSSRSSRACRLARSRRHCRSAKPSSIIAIATPSRSFATSSGKEKTMAEFEELLVNEWRALLASLEDALEVAPSPLALPAARRLPLSPKALFAQLEEVREEWRALPLGDPARRCRALRQRSVDSQRPRRARCFVGERVSPRGRDGSPRRELRLRDPLRHDRRGTE